MRGLGSRKKYQPFMLATLLLYFMVLSGYLLWPFNFDFSRKNNARWIENGYGIEFPERGLLITNDAPDDLFRKLITGSGITIVVWIESSIAIQHGPARIISYSIDPHYRNFTLGQSEDALILRLRTATTDLNGLNQQIEVKNIFTEKKIRQVAATYSSGKRCIYIDGNINTCDDQLKGDFSNWDSSHKLIIGNEASGNRPWIGKIYYAAIFNRVLTEKEITQNFKAGCRKAHAKMISLGNYDSGPIVSYLFEEKAASVIYDKSGHSAPTNLFIPKKIPREKVGIVMLSLSDNFEDISSLSNILLNILGFLPLGFLLCAYLNLYSLTLSRIIFSILAIALTVSFGFEILHYYLPNQHSSAVEVFLKMLGISFGTVAFFTLCRTTRYKMSKIPSTQINH